MMNIRPGISRRYNAPIAAEHDCGTKASSRGQRLLGVLPASEAFQKMA